MSVSAPARPFFLLRWPIVAPLAYPNFALLWIGRIVSLAGALGDLLGPRGLILLGGLVTTASGIRGLSRPAMRNAT